MPYSDHFWDEGEKSYFLKSSFTPKDVDTAKVKVLFISCAQDLTYCLTW